MPTFAPPLYLHHCRLQHYRLRQHPGHHSINHSIVSAYNRQHPGHHSINHSIVSAYNRGNTRSSYYTIIQAMHEDASSAVWALFLAAAEPVGWFVKSFSLSSCFFFQPEFMFILRRRGLLLRSFFRLVRLFYSTSLPLGCEVHFSFPSFLLFSL